MFSYIICRGAFSNREILTLNHLNKNIQQPIIFFLESIQFLGRKNVFSCSPWEISNSPEEIVKGFKCVIFEAMLVEG